MFAGIGGTAYAAGFNFSVTPRVAEMTSGGEVTFDMYIVNENETSLEGYSIKMDGKTVHSNAASVAAGQTLPDSFKANVPTEKLGVAITFQLCDSGGNPTEATSTVTIKKSVNVSLDCTVKASKTLVALDDQVTFTFTVQNKGNVKIENIEIFIPEIKSSRLNESAFAREVGSNSHKFEYPYTVKKFGTFNPKIKYKANGKTYEDDLTKITLTEEVRQVDVYLSASTTTPEPNEEVTFTLRIENNGNVPYTDLAVTWNGQKMDFPTTKLNPGDKKEKTYSLPFDTSQEVAFIITLKDHTKVVRQVTTNRIDIQMPIDPGSISSNVGFVIESDRPALTAAGIITFSGYVFNDSGYKISEVRVTEPTLGEIFSVSEMETGTKQSINKTVDINETTTYSFTLTVKDRNGQIYTVNHDPVTVEIQDVSDPSPTETVNEAVDISPPPVDKPANPLNVWLIIVGVLLLLIIGVGAALVVLWKKGKTPMRSSAARRPSSSRPSLSRPSPSRPSPSRPRTMGGKFSRSKGKGFKDRNNF